MTTTIHKNLTGADLHEPKGAAAALAGQVYVADGLGSGAWTPASSVVTNTAFTTGDLKSTFKTVADAGWILWVDGAIGDGSSGASIRANADTATLYTLLWANGNSVVGGGKGASAAIDFAAHKPLSIPIGAGRYMANANSTNTVGAPYGALTVTLIAANLPPVTSSGNNAISVLSNTSDIIRGPSFSAGVVLASGSAAAPLTGTSIPAQIQSQNPSQAISVTSTGTTSTPVNVSPLSVAVNVMIKL